MELSPDLKEKAKQYFEKKAGREFDDAEVQTSLERLAQLGALFAENVDKLADRLDTKEKAG